MVVNSFRKALPRGCLTALSVRVGLGICIMPEFCNCQGSEYTFSSECTKSLIIPLVLNMLGF